MQSTAPNNEWIKDAQRCAEERAGSTEIKVIPINNGETICEEANRIVSGPRGDKYDHPYHNFRRTGILWWPVLEKWAKETGGNAPIPPELVGQCMIMVKQAREIYKHTRDNLTDTAGYSQTVDMVYEYKSEHGAPETQ